MNDLPRRGAPTRSSDLPKEASSRIDTVTVPRARLALPLPFARRKVIGTLSTTPSGRCECDFNPTPSTSLHYDNGRATGGDLQLIRCHT